MQKIFEYAKANKLNNYTFLFEIKAHKNELIMLKVGRNSLNLSKLKVV